MKILTPFIALTIFVLSVVVMPQTAHADLQAIRSENNSLWFAAGGDLFGYQENVTPLPDSEHGWLSSFASGVSMMTNNNLYLSVDTSVAFGDANYNGALLATPNVPFHSKTSETISTIDGKIGQGFALGSLAMVTPYADLGYRYWDRKLSANQTEDYQNFEILGGAMLQIAPTSRLVFTGYGAAGTTFAGKMETGGSTFDLGPAGIYKVGAKVGVLVIPRVEAFTSVDYTHFRYVESGVVNGFYEPSSHSENTAWRIGVAYHYR